MTVPLVSTLRAAGRHPTPVEVAEVLWLAQFLPEPPVPPEQPEPAAETPDPARHSLPDSARAVADQLPTTLPADPVPVVDTPIHAAAKTRPSEARSSAGAEDPGPTRTGNTGTGPAPDDPALPRSTGLNRGGVTATPVGAPAVTGLPQSLALGRSLRPFKRRVRTGPGVRLDEAATVARIVDERLCVPVLRPVPARWLNVTVVFDVAPSMRLWQRTQHDLLLLLQRLGAFGDVRVLYVDGDQPASVPLLLTTRAGPGAVAVPWSTLPAGAAGRELILTVTDGVGAAWRDGRMERHLRSWGANAVVALISVLPRPLWTGGGVRPLPAQVRLGQSGIPNQRWEQRPQQRRTGSAALPSVPVPIFELSPRWMTALAAMVTGGWEWSNAALLAPAGSPASGTPAAPDAAAQLTDLHRVQRFRATASPTALQLASHLAAAPLTLPVMRLVQQVMLPNSAPVHLAEVFLGGLLRQVTPVDPDSDPDSVEYDFIGGVRELLLDLGDRDDAAQVLVDVSAFVHERLGQSFDFAALLADPAGNALPAVSDGTRPLGRVSQQVLRRLGGRYAALADRLAAEFSDASRTGAIPAFHLQPTQLTPQVGRPAGSGSADPAQQPADPDRRPADPDRRSAAADQRPADVDQPVSGTSGSASDKSTFRGTVTVDGAVFAWRKVPPVGGGADHFPSLLSAEYSEVFGPGLGPLEVLAGLRRECERQDSPPDAYVVTLPARNFRALSEHAAEVADLLVQAQAYYLAKWYPQMFGRIVRLEVRAAKGWRPGRLSFSSSHPADRRGEPASAGAPGIDAPALDTRTGTAPPEPPSSTAPPDWSSGEPGTRERPSLAATSVTPSSRGSVPDAAPVGGLAPQQSAPQQPDPHQSDPQQSAGQRIRTRDLSGWAISGRSSNVALVAPDGQVYRLPIGRTIIGRGDQARIRLLDSSVSRTHAELHFDGRRVSIVDLKSVNGVLVNGERVTSAWLQPGDWIVLGATQLQLLESEHPGRPTTPPGDGRAGQVIAERYRLTSLIRTVETGQSWLAKDIILGRPVTLREIVLPGWIPPADRTKALTSVLQSISRVAAVHSPNVAQLYDLIVDGPTQWLVTEAWPERSLGDELAAGRTVTTREGVRLGLDLLEGLTAVHAAGLVHGNVCPENVLPRTDGTNLLVDCGLSLSVTDFSYTLFDSPDTSGLCYLAPERVTGAGRTPASDLYALGATLYAALEGAPPFIGTSALDTLDKIVTGSPPDFQRSRPFAELLAGLLERDPNLRWSTNQTRGALLTVAGR